MQNHMIYNYAHAAPARGVHILLHVFVVRLAHVAVGKMSRKTEYNVRFCFEDPLSKMSVGRSSCYRIRKRKRQAEASAAGESTTELLSSDAELGCLATTSSLDGILIIRTIMTPRMRQWKKTRVLIKSLPIVLT